jgi:threonine synthase
MDIQISSNFERFIFEVAGRDAARVRELMASLATDGAFSLNQGEHAALKQLLVGASIDEDQTRETIRRLHERTGMICDPHTAVGVGAAANEPRDAAVPMIMLATAHAAKFPDAVASAIGVRPAEPERLARQRQLAERVVRLPNDLSAVADYIGAHARVGRSG